MLQPWPAWWEGYVQLEYSMLTAWTSSVITPKQETLRLTTNTAICRCWSSRRTGVHNNIWPCRPDFLDWTVFNINFQLGVFITHFKFTI